MTTLNRIGDVAVKRATGRTWAQWVTALDRAGAATKTQREIAALVQDRFGLDRPGGDRW